MKEDPFTEESVSRPGKAYFHLPGLFEFTDFYRIFLALYREHRDYFYDWCEIGSLYGAPAGCLWGGGRVGFGDDDPESAAQLVRAYQIPARLTFSNSLLREPHLSDPVCNALCEQFNADTGVQNGVIVYSDLLLEYLQNTYGNLYFVSSTTKVITDFRQFQRELQRKDFANVVPDFRLNKQLDKLSCLSAEEKQKVEFLCNECCYFGCTDRKACYENVSRKSLGEPCADHVCRAPDAGEGYRFSKAMTNPGFISLEDIQNVYLPMGFCNFKIEGRGLGSAILLEFLLYYMTKPACQLLVREAMYLDSMLDLF